MFSLVLCCSRCISHLPASLRQTRPDLFPCFPLETYLATVGDRHLPVERRAAGTFLRDVCEGGPSSPGTSFCPATPLLTVSSRENRQFRIAGVHPQEGGRHPTLHVRAPCTDRFPSAQGETGKRQDSGDADGHLVGGPGRQGRWRLDDCAS